MPPVVDLTRDLRDLAELASDPAQVDELLGRALESLEAVIPYDLAAVLTLDGDRLSVRAARGRLADKRVADHSIALSDFPSVRRALETRRARALEEHDHAGDEGDPYDGVLNLPHGHSCMVVPLYAGDRTLGAITFDRTACEVYREDLVRLADTYGQIISLAMISAEQAALLHRYRHRLEAEKEALEERSVIAGLEGARDPWERTRSPAVRRVVELARQAAPAAVPVLVLGETGVGKEVLARAVHRWSGRPGPFVAINCAALPDTLVESELFGHTRGAFSGADRARDGRFVTANGGTLFLDEVGDLPAPVQAKLLRVLQDGTFEPVGADRTVKVDVRVLAATNVDLERAVKAKAFREDLLFRLNIFPLVIPPLRERLEDLPSLCGAILDELHQRSGRGPWTLDQDLLDDLAKRDWPGNVRELVNVLERATILTPAGPLRLDGAARPGSTDAASLSPPPADLPTLAEHERRYIEQVLEATEGRIYGEGGAAQVLDLHPSTLQSRMKKLGVERPRRRRRAS